MACDVLNPAPRRVMNRRHGMRWVAVAALCLLTACAGVHGAAGGMTTDSNSGNSSDSGGSSGNSSGNSAGSSGESGASSGASLNSTANIDVTLGESTQNTANSTIATGDASGGTSAQSTRESAESSAASTRATTGPLLSTVAVGATLAGIGAIIWALQPAVAPAAANPAAAQAFLRSHQRQLRQDLALGAGPALEDLAHAAGIRPEHLARFGKLLRANRAELLVLMAPEALTPERAVQALRRIGELAKGDPALASAAEARVRLANPES